MRAPIRSDHARSALRELLASEASGGVALMLSAVLALVVANSAWADIYFTTLKSDVGGLSVLHWINDGLMSLFFLLVGLEIKREFLDGQLQTWSRRVLPGVAALGGMAAPALLYFYFNQGAPETLRGWAIPAATDIAFALGALALLGSRVPVSLKVFLTALAIIDDLGAVAIIAAVYAAHLSIAWLGAALVLFGALLLLNRLGVERIPLYAILGGLLWIAVLRSGVHATVAGVLLAFAIPLRKSSDPSAAGSPLHAIEHALHPWVGFGVLPLFGFANAGVSLHGLSVSTALTPVSLGIASGLFVGKQIGVFLAAWIVIRLGFASRPAGATWPQVYATAAFCGIGFTMSLFIGLLAFQDAEQLQSEVKIGVLFGSLLSAAMGTAIFLSQSRRMQSG